VCFLIYVSIEQFSKSICSPKWCIPVILSMSGFISNAWTLALSNEHIPKPLCSSYACPIKLSRYRFGRPSIDTCLHPIEKQWNAWLVNESALVSCTFSRYVCILHIFSNSICFTDAKWLCMDQNIQLLYLLFSSKVYCNLGIFLGNAEGWSSDTDLPQFYIPQ